MAQSFLRYMIMLGRCLLFWIGGTKFLIFTVDRNFGQYGTPLVSKYLRIKKLGKYMEQENRGRKSNKLVVYCKMCENLTIDRRHNYERNNFRCREIHRR